MATFFKPAVVEQNSAKRTHMSRVDEYQILNGHYVRLRSTKAAVDMKTPRSQHTLGKVRRQPVEPYRTIQSFPSRSRSMELKRTTSELTITKMSRNLSPTSHSVKPMSMMEIRRIQLSQSLTSLKQPINPRLSKSFNYGPYVKQRTLSNQYERRFLDTDLMDKNFFMFNQPKAAHNPRLLLFNLQRSKIAKMTRVYNPPMNRNRLRALSNLNATWHPGVNNDGNDDLLLEQSSAQLAESFKFFQQRERLSPNAFYVKRPSRGDLLQFVKPALTKEEQEEILAWNFLRDVTENLIIAQTYSDTALCQIFQNSINNWKRRLPEAKLKALVSKLLDDLHIPTTGALIVFQEPRDIVKPIIVEPPEEESYRYSEPDEEEEEEEDEEEERNEDNEKSVELSAYDEEADVESVHNSKRESDKEKNANNRNGKAQTPSPKKRGGDEMKSSKDKRTAWTKAAKIKAVKNLPAAKINTPRESENEIEEEMASVDENEIEEVASDGGKNVSGKGAKSDQEPYEESIADDSQIHSPAIAKSFKEQELSKSDSIFDNDKSSAATMGEVSDIDEDDGISIASRKEKKKKVGIVNKQNSLLSDGGKPIGFGPSHDDGPDKLTKPAKVVKNKQRKYSWESSQSSDDDKPVKQTIKDKEPINMKTMPSLNSDKVDRAMQEINDKPNPRTLGNRENTAASLTNDDTKSLSQSQKPKERRRWWPSKESSLPPPSTENLQRQVNSGDYDGDELPLSGGSFEKNPIADEIRKKREPFLQKLAETRQSVSDGAGSDRSTERKLSPKDDKLASEQLSLTKVAAQPPVPAKRLSVSSQRQRAESSTADIAERGSARSTDDDGVFDVPEDAALRGDYGGRRLSQLISQMATESDGADGPSRNHGVLVRSPRIDETSSINDSVHSNKRHPDAIKNEIEADLHRTPSNSSGRLGSAGSSGGGGGQRRRSSTTINQQQRQTSTIYETDETPADRLGSPDKLPNGKTSDEESASGGSQSNEDAEQLAMTKSTRVLKNALNALALAATSDESDKDEPR